jgi:hypothetical protein
MPLETADFRCSFDLFGANLRYQRAVSLSTPFETISKYLYVCVL